MRVYELAKDLGIDSKELLAQAHELGIEVKTASSGLDDESAELLRLAVAGDEPEVVEAEPEAESEAAEEVAPEPAPEPEVELDIVSVPSGASVSEFADALGVPAKDVVAQLLTRGQAVGAGQTMPPELIEDVAESFGFIVDIEAPPPPPAVAERPVFEDSESELAPRPACCDRDGTRGSRENHPSRLDPQDQRGRGGARRDHPAHRRLPGRCQRTSHHIHRHAGSRGVHLPAGPRSEHHRHRDPGGGCQRRCHAPDRRSDLTRQGGRCEDDRGRQQSRSSRSRPAPGADRAHRARRPHRGARRRRPQCGGLRNQR